MESKGKKCEIYLVLDNVRSVHNVGSIFRTADCLGVTEIILIGVTPAPIDRFGRARGDFAKVSLGAEKTLSWRTFVTLAEAVKFLKSIGVQIITVEQSKDAVDYKKVKPQFPVGFIFGNEVDGLSPNTLRQADIVAEIPMLGSKESLNVGVAVGIALSRILNR